MAMKHRRDPAKELFWRRMMDLWQDSGLTIRAFCQQRNLTNDSFYFWRAELARRDQEVLQSSTTDRSVLSTKWAGVGYRIGNGHDLIKRIA